MEPPKPLSVMLNEHGDGGQNILIADGKIVDKVHEDVTAVCIAVLCIDNFAGIQTVLVTRRCRADSAVECILMLDYLLYCYLPLLPIYLLP